MAEITAQEVKRLRDATGAGMMDCKKALIESDGDFDLAVEALRKKGLAKAAERADRENREGAVALATGSDRAALVQLKSETDFTAKTDAYLALVQKLADAVLSDGEGAVDALAPEIEDLKLVTKENIEIGRVVRFEAAPGNALDTYVHIQDGRGVSLKMESDTAASCEAFSAMMKEYEALNEKVREEIQKRSGGAGK